MTRIVLGVGAFFASAKSCVSDEQMTWRLQKAYNVKKASALLVIFSMFLFNAMPVAFVQSSGLGIYATEDSEASFVPEGLVINELMADNQITIAGPDGTYPDWIELFYDGNETIDLSGMYLTDDLTNPTSWRFPNDTVIEPPGYLLIWADNSTDQTSLHASFALSANGEEVGLFASDGLTLIDSVVFTKQIGDVSYGRFPDGDPNWTYLLKATPGWGNNKTQVNSETSVWSILLPIGLIIALSALIVVAGKINSRRR